MPRCPHHAHRCWPFEGCPRALALARRRRVPSPLLLPTGSSSSSLTGCRWLAPSAGFAQAPCGLASSSVGALFSPSNRAGLPRGPPTFSAARSCSAAPEGCLPLLHSNAARISRPASGGGRGAAAPALSSPAPPFSAARSSRPASLPGCAAADCELCSSVGDAVRSPAEGLAAGSSGAASSALAPRGRPHISQGLLDGRLRKVQTPHCQSQAVGRGRAVGVALAATPALASWWAALAPGHMEAGR